MKYHKTLDECFIAYCRNADSWITVLLLSGIKLEHLREIFEEGWYACASEINNGEDSDWLQERLYEEGFLKESNNGV